MHRYIQVVYIIDSTAVKFYANIWKTIESFKKINLTGRKRKQLFA